MYLFTVFFLVSLVNGMLLLDKDYADDNASTSNKLEIRSEKIELWSEAAYQWFVVKNCTDQNFLSEATCFLMKLMTKNNFRVYGAEPVADKKYGLVFPDSDTKRKTFHDGVFVLDPFPAARFGHPILVFYVDLNMKRAQCEAVNGFLTGTSEDGNCLQPLQPLSKAYCNKFGYNRLKWLSALGANCEEIVFLPLVHLQTDLPVQSNDKLRCYANIKGFNQSCPQLRAKSETDRLSCDPILTNQNCGFLENSLSSRCSTSQTCDHAVLLSGGWNRQLSDISTFRNIMNVKQLLMNQGFLDTNIEMFYANGQDNSQVNDEEIRDSAYYSSSLKTAMRNHIRTICDSEYCADTFFIYMNSPASPDGASLLWDSFDNGMYDETEIYTARELMRDISHCKANRVVIIADQSYGGPLVAAAEARFISLQNVIIFTSAEEFNWNSSKDRLTKLLMRGQYSDICLNELKNIFYYTYKSPVFIGSQADLLNSTLVGAPCTGKSTSLNDPDTFKYRGCSLPPIV